MMDQLGIEQLSVLGLDPVSCIELADKLDCRNISIFLSAPPFRPQFYPPFSLVDDPALRRATMAALRDHNVSISLGEGFSVRPGSDLCESKARDLEIMAELGVNRINMVSFDPDLSRTFDQFAALVECAANLGMESTVEFSKSDNKSICDLATALAAIDHVGRSDFRLLIDCMHFFRSGGRVEDIRAISAEQIGYIQLCDAPLVSTFGSYMEEAMNERMVPGTGELPLLELLNALPHDRIVSLEVPQRSLALAGMEPIERLRTCVIAARQLLLQRNTARTDIGRDTK